MKRILVSGMVAIAMAASPVVAAAQTAPATSEASAEERNEHLGFFRDPLITGLSLLGALLVAYLIFDGLTEDDETPTSP